MADATSQQKLAPHPIHAEHRKLDPRCTGRLAPVAANILMQVLYAARYARCDVIRCINMMACYTTKWTATQDQELDDLMGYVMETVTWKTWAG